MKKLFRKKNILVFFLIYGILTLLVSLYHLIIGRNADPLGYWHEIYRFFFVLILLLLYDLLRNLNLKRNWKSFLEQLLPLLLALAGLGLVLYLKGDLDLSRIATILGFLIGALIGLFFLRAIVKSLYNWLRSIFSGRKKIYFSFISLLLLVILFTPIVIYLLINRGIDLMKVFRDSVWYLASVILFLLLMIGLFLSGNQTDEFDPLTIILILLYYVSWFFIGYQGALFTHVLVMQILGCGVMLAYENHNGFHHCIPMTMLLTLLLSIACIA